MAAAKDKYSVKQFLNDENRQGVKMFLEEHFKVEDEIDEEYLDELLQMLADDASVHVMVSEFHRRIKAFMADEENDFLYAQVMSALRYVMLYAYDLWDDGTVTYPLMEAEDLPGRTIFPVYTRKALTHDPELEGYDLEEDIFYNIWDWMRDAGADCFVLNPGTHGCVLDLDDACGYYSWMDGLSDSITDILCSGVSKEDLFPALKAQFTNAAVECFLEDGTYLKGLFVTEDLNAAGFTLLPVDDKGYPTDEGEVCQVLYNDLETIRFMEEDPADADADEDEE